MAVPITGISQSVLITCILFTNRVMHQLIFCKKYFNSRSLFTNIFKMSVLPDIFPPGSNKTHQLIVAQHKYKAENLTKNLLKLKFINRAHYSTMAVPITGVSQSVLITCILFTIRVMHQLMVRSILFLEVCLQIFSK